MHELERAFPKSFALNAVGTKVNLQPCGTGSARAASRVRAGAARGRAGAMIGRQVVITNRLTAPEKSGTDTNIESFVPLRQAGEQTAGVVNENPLAAPHGSAKKRVSRGGFRDFKNVRKEVRCG
jgi:hypothetical protein